MGVAPPAAAPPAALPAAAGPCASPLAWLSRWIACANIQPQYASLHRCTIPTATVLPPPWPLLLPGNAPLRPHLCSALIQQFDRLKIKYEAESAAFKEQLTGQPTGPSVPGAGTPGLPTAGRAEKNTVVGPLAGGQVGADGSRPWQPKDLPDAPHPLPCRAQVAGVLGPQPLHVRGDHGPTTDRLPGGHGRGAARGTGGSRRVGGRVAGGHSGHP